MDELILYMSHEIYFYYLTICLMMKLTVLGLACLTIVSSLYCASICAANTYVDCSTTGPSSCTLCDSTYFLGGGCLAGPAAGLAFI